MAAVTAAFVPVSAAIAQVTALSPKVGVNVTVLPTVSAPMFFKVMVRMPEPVTVIAETSLVAVNVAGKAAGVEVVLQASKPPASWPHIATAVLYGSAAVSAFAALAFAV